MKFAAVAEISFFENIILQSIVEVEDDATWKDVYLKYYERKESKDQNVIDWVMGMPDDLDEARSQLADGEMDICVTFYT